jgi:PKHD-type hydroxylase
MIYEIDFLTSDEVRRINEQYDKTTTWKDGVVSIGENVVDPNFKVSKQLDPHGVQYRYCMDVIQKKLRSNKDIASVFLLDDLTPPLMTQYDTGGFYKRHVDSIDIQNLRTDHSITVFLNDPDDYEGGELSIQLGDTWHHFKLKAGKALVYPTGVIHEIRQVTSGHRRVALMWAKSMVDDAFIRYELINFARGIQNILPFMHEKEEDATKIQDLIVPFEQVRSNILRVYGNLS